MTIQSIQFKKHWGFWAKGYLKLAEQGFLSLKNKPNIGRIKFFEKLKLMYSLEDGHLVVASIWNIKHGIELIIKAIGIVLDDKYWMKHDLDFLLKDLKGRIGGFCVQKHFDILAKLVDKYYNCDFSLKTKFLDKRNTLFKYPEDDDCTKVGGVKISLDYSFVHDLGRKDINQFLRDISNLGLIYDKIEGQPQHFKSAKKYGLTQKQAEKRLLSVESMKKDCLR